MPKNVAPNSTDPPSGFFESRQPAPIMADHSRRSSKTNTSPSATVTPSQPTLADFRPAWADRTAPTMVRLLVSNATVIAMPVAIVGQNSNGLGQSGLAIQSSH